MGRFAPLSAKRRKFVDDSVSSGVSLNRMVWRRFRRNKLAFSSLVLIGLMTLTAIAGYLITPDHTPHCNQQYLELTALKPMSRATFVHTKLPEGSPTRRGLLHRMCHGEPLPYRAQPVYSWHYEGDTLVAESYTGSIPNDGETLRLARSEVIEVTQRTFILGTDSYGRDVLSLLLIGSRVSLSVGFIAILIALLIGITLGSLAGYFGGWVDNATMWFINVVWSIPTVLLVIAITFALGKGFWQVFVAVGLTMWVDIARVVRGQVMSLKEKEYVEAARALGFRSGRIIFHHILPNTVGALIVIAASNFASAILLEAGLSFLGIGVQPPMVSWGSMVKENTGHLLLDNAYLALLPGAAIMVVVLAFMLLGTGIRDAVDVKR